MVKMMSSTPSYYPHGLEVLLSHSEHGLIALDVESDASSVSSMA